MPASAKDTSVLSSPVTRAFQSATASACFSDRDASMLFIAVASYIRTPSTIEFSANLFSFPLSFLCYHPSTLILEENAWVNVNWLRTRLDEIKDAVDCIVEKKKVNDEKNKIVEQINGDKKDLQSMKDELEKLKSEIEKKENLLDLDVLLIEDMSTLINDRALRIQEFQNMPLMEAFQ